MNPEIGKIYFSNNFSIPLWKCDILGQEYYKIVIDKDLVGSILPNKNFCILEYKISNKKNKNNNLLYCKVLTESGQVGTICIFQRNFASWITKDEA